MILAQPRRPGEASGEAIFRTTLTAILLTIPIGLFGCVRVEVPDPGQRGSYAVGQITVTVDNPDSGTGRETDIYYPAGGSSVDPSGAPYATLVFASGILSFASNYSRNGEHLASWGYIVAIPHYFSEDSEVRASDMRNLVSYFEAENARPGSPFYGRIDTSRFGVTGHSTGGEAALKVAARDARIKAAVPLDPAGNPLRGGKALQQEVAQIAVPLAVVGSPPHVCNSFAYYNTLYPAVGSEHKSKIVLAGASHCDFMDTDNELTRLCYLPCGGQYSQERVQLIERYTTAWFNYYLHGETEYYTYLYGSQAGDDVQAGRITLEFQTAQRDVEAAGQPGAVRLSWTRSDYAVIAGYNIYRSEHSGSYPGVPYARVDRVSSYVDTGVVAGRQYFYILRSRDAEDNEHRSSAEVQAVPDAAVNE